MSAEAWIFLGSCIAVLGGLFIEHMRIIASLRGTNTLAMGAEAMATEARDLSRPTGDGFANFVRGAFARIEARLDQTVTRVDEVINRVDRLEDRLPCQRIGCQLARPPDNP